MINEVIEEVLNDYGELIVEAIIQSLSDADRVATGRTADSVSYRVEGSTLTVEGRDSIMTLEYGRSPTGQGTGSGGGASGSFFQQIVEWVEAKGIETGAAWAIYKKINEEGFEGTPGVISEPVDRLILKMEAEIEYRIEQSIDLKIESLFNS